MTKLKTLKDFDLQGAYDDTEHSIEDLRQEAIKWIKELENQKSREFADFCYEHGGEYEETTFAIINWIKHFFNIIEKDIKEESE